MTTQKETRNSVALTAEKLIVADPGGAYGDFLLDITPYSNRLAGAVRHGSLDDLADRVIDGLRLLHPDFFEQEDKVNLTVSYTFGSPSHHERLRAAMHLGDRLAAAGHPATALPCLASLYAT